ncbi:MAG: bifunctional DNA primase/polymerase [Coriobacteriales bacterium]|jgi:hypothetical protein|nr:bifunctional DNA primase/polymerase [Coriobacteriales bacterium]
MTDSIQKGPVIGSDDPTGAMPGQQAMAATDNPLLKAALRYAGHGLAVFPSAPGEQEPHGLKDATCDPERIRGFWQAEPDANVGIACGAVSGGLWVLEADGKETLRLWSEEGGVTPPESPVAITGGGRFHHYFRSRVPLRSRGGIMPGIDIVGEGGHVLAPPSVCPSGSPCTWAKTYAWAAGAGVADAPKAGARSDGAHWTPANMDSVDLLTPYLTMPRWVCWRYRQYQGEPKPRKVPVAVRGPSRGRQTSAAAKALSYDDSRYCPDEWGTYQDAMRECARSECDGIGIVLGNGLVGIDIDGRSEADPAVTRIVNVMESYTERSPSGSGLHVLCAVGQRTLGQLEGFRSKNEGEGFEFYWHSRYFTFTGDVLLEAPVETRDEEALAFCKHYMSRGAGTARSSKAAPANRTARQRATWEPREAPIYSP